MKTKIDGIEQVTKVLAELNENMVNLIESIRVLKIDIKTLGDTIQRNTRR